MQNKPDACDARKYVNTDKERSRNDESLRNNYSLSDGIDDGSNDGFIFPYKMKKWDSNEKGDTSYGSYDERNKKGVCHNNSETSRWYIGNNEGKIECSIQNYVRCDIVDDEFEAQNVKFFKARRLRALTRKECIDILMLQVHLRK